MYARNSPLLRHGIRTFTRRHGPNHDAVRIRRPVRNLNMFSGACHQNSSMAAATTAVAAAVALTAYTVHDTMASCEFHSINNIAPTKEPATGILFPKLCNGLTFVGCGVRYKYGFVKVYAVGAYIDPIAMNAVKKEGVGAIEEALLDPMYPKTIRIVMNRNLSAAKFADAIAEALEPRMGGKDLDKLKEFKDLNPPVDLVQGAEMIMTIRGDTMMYTNCAGGIGAIHSRVFCEALCDTYFGKDCVSASLKKDVVEGVRKL